MYDFGDVLQHGEGSVQPTAYRLLSVRLRSDTPKSDMKLPQTSSVY